MIDTWFTSDTHFGHKNILEYEKEARPFSSIEEMHEVMIERWNSVVKPKDVIYHLGDFAFGRQYIKIAARLNGRKKLIMGNHDSYPTSLYLEHFEKLYGVVFWERCILSHVPVHSNGLGARWMLNVHGHLHSKKVKAIENPYKDVNAPVDIFGNDLNYLNVSVEQNNLTPIHRDVIHQRLEIL